MSKKKEWPWFKFTALKWISGKITMSEYYEQGVFINICALYWKEKGNLTMKEAQRRLKGAKPKAFAQLVEDGVIKLDGEDIVIEFLDEQFDDQAGVSQTNSENGKKGGRGKRKESENKPNALIPVSESKAKKSNIDKDEEIELDEEGEKELLSNSSNPELHEKTQEDEVGPRLNHPFETKKGSGEKVAPVKTEADKTGVPASATNTPQPASFWRERLTEQMRIARRRAITGKFSKATPQQIEILDANYDAYWDLRYPNGSTMMDYSRCFNWYVSDQKNLPEVASGNSKPALSYSLNKKQEPLT